MRAAAPLLCRPCRGWSGARGWLLALMLRFLSRDTTSGIPARQTGGGASHWDTAASMPNVVVLRSRWVLRGGGPRKSAALRDQRRREVLAEEWKRQGLHNIDTTSRWSKDGARREGTVQAVQAARKKEETFEEYSARQQMPAWKLAELRRRSQEEHPEARWGKKWRERLGLPEKGAQAENEAQEESDDESSLPEGWPKLRTINDHKGNIDHPYVSDIPENLTDVNDRLQWFEENMVFWNREVEYEDLGR